MPKIRRIGSLLFPALLLIGQDHKPNFAGNWRPVGGVVTTRIEQTDTTFTIRPILTEGVAINGFVYPTDGTERTTRSGRQHFTRTGHWEGKKLILESTGPGNAPWRHRSTTRQVISLSDDNKIMEMTFHVLGGDSRHDYEIDSERVPE